MRENHQRDPSAREVLLVTDIFIRRHQNVEARLFGIPQQFAVPRLCPTSLPRLDDGMACQRASDAARDVVVRQYQRSVTRRFVEAARREFKHGIAAAIVRQPAPGVRQPAAARSPRVRRRPAHFEILNSPICLAMVWNAVLSPLALAAV